MVRNISEVNITNWNDTGLTTPFPRYTFNLEIKWTDDEGVLQTHGPQLYTFPNDLADMPLIVRRRFSESMINAVVRVALGINTWENFE